MQKFDYARTALSPAARQAVVEGLLGGTAGGSHATQYDVVVIGMGVTGAGVALDAATRGLSVLIVDKHDIAYGTSRWSSKLAHGGLRYLASGNVGIARRSAVERGILMTVTAPHLTRALPQVVPVMKRFSVANRLLPRVGFLAGDGLRIAAGTPGSVLPRSRTISAKRVAELCPAVDADAVQCGYLNYDGQLIDDARLVTALVRTAAGFGADVLTHAEVTGVDTGTGVVDLSVADPEGGADSTSGTTAGTALTVRAGAIVNATGVWAGHLSPQVQVTPSRGTHIVIDAARVGNPTGALTVPVPGATNRFCFILPAQMGRCYVGLTDEQAPSIEDVPTAPAEDVEWVLDVVNQALKTSLTTDDVLGTFAGLRPLVTLNAAASGSTAAHTAAANNAAENTTAENTTASDSDSDSDPTGLAAQGRSAPNNTAAANNAAENTTASDSDSDSDPTGLAAQDRNAPNNTAAANNAEEQTHTADLSREHLILTEGRMVTVTGGKLTEYRLMAEQTVDTVLNQVLDSLSRPGTSDIPGSRRGPDSPSVPNGHRGPSSHRGPDSPSVPSGHRGPDSTSVPGGRRVHRSPSAAGSPANHGADAWRGTAVVGPCVTKTTPLVGAQPPRTSGVVAAASAADSTYGSFVGFAATSTDDSAAASAAGSSADYAAASAAGSPVAAHNDVINKSSADRERLRTALEQRFGHEAPYVIASSLLDRPWEPVAPGVDVTRAEFSFAVTHEGAMTVDDILERRTRIGMIPEQREACLPAAEEALCAGFDHRQ